MCICSNSNVYLPYPSFLHTEVTYWRLYPSSWKEGSLPSMKKDLNCQHVTSARSARGRRRAENCLQHNSLHVCTHTRSRSGGGAGAKSAPQQMGPSPNFPRPLRNRALQTIFVLKKWQIRPRPLRVCVNIPAVAERECQIPSVSAPQPLRAYVNVALAIFQSH